jgi:integrase
LKLGQTFRGVKGGEETSRECPNCHSKRNWKAGVRQTQNWEVQRFLCRDCGFRFSEKFNIELVMNRGRQLCAIFEEAKKLDTTTETKTVAGDRKIDNATAKGLLLQYELWLQKEGYGKKSRYIDCIRMLINSGADLYGPENVKKVIAKKKWKNGTKMQACYAYNAMTKMLKLSWVMPTYKQEENLPFIPEAKEINQLIASCNSKLVATYLQTLKETMADPTEAIRLRWIDYNPNENSIIINRPVKNHNPRKLPISNQLVSMLNILPKKSELIFNTSYAKIAKRFRNYRRRAAANLQNPRILSITLRTFRHYGATMLYAQTRNILLVMKTLGHKKIENTMKYTQLVNFKTNAFETATATNIEEAKQLISSGFEYVTEMKGIKLFRKPKRFIS